MSQETVAAQDMLTRFAAWQGRAPESVAADTTSGNGEFLQWLGDRNTAAEATLAGGLPFRTLSTVIRDTSRNPHEADRTHVRVAKCGCIGYAARVNDSGLSKPLGRTLQRKEIGSFVFVHHDYPSQAGRATHSHPWLHLTIVCRGLYSRKLGRQSVDYKTGSVSFLQTNESHTDWYGAGSKCLHVVIPSKVEKELTSACGTQGIAHGISPDLSAGASIALQRESRNTDTDSPLIVEALLLDLMSRHLDVLRERSAARPKWLDTLLDYLDDTFEQEWTLTNMAAEVGVHAVHLCRTNSLRLRM